MIAVCKPLLLWGLSATGGLSEAVINL